MAALVRRQGSQVSMRVASGSASWLSSHGRGLGSRDVLILRPQAGAKYQGLCCPEKGSADPSIPSREKKAELRHHAARFICEDRA